MLKLKSFAVIRGLFLGLSLLLQPPALPAAEEPGVAPAVVSSATTESTNALPPVAPVIESTNTPSLVTRLEQLQEQQQFILRALDQIRQEAKSTEQQNAESITGRLALIEQGLVGERHRELEAIQKWNLLTLVVVGGFAIVGFLALLLVAPFLVRALNRMTDAAATLHVQQSSRPALPDSRETPLLPNSAVAQSTARFMDAMDRVEKRIHQLEQTVQLPQISVEPHSNGAKPSAVGPHEPASAPTDRATPVPDARARAELVLERGKALLHLGDTERALVCFDEAIGLEPEWPEVYIKRGQALEKLKRTDEALASYDRAVALEPSSATAYLCKGSLLNQLARYNEALQCYELALRVREGVRSEGGELSRV